MFAPKQHKDERETLRSAQGRVFNSVASAAGNRADGCQHHHQMFLLSVVQGLEGLQV